MKVVVIGMDPRFLETVAVGVRVRWPDAILKYAINARKGLELVEQKWPDLVVLSDIQDSSSYEFIQNLRAFSNVPMLVLGKSANDMEAAICLEAGADDYVRLPCDLPELAVRLWALVRRADSIDSYQKEGPLNSGELLLNPATYEAYMGEERLALTYTEFQMLFILVRNWGIVVPRKALEEELWAERTDSYNLVKKYVQRLRVKLLDDSRAPCWIANVHGVGYRFVGPAPTASEFMPAL